MQGNSLVPVAIETASLFVPETKRSTRRERDRNAILSRIGRLRLSWGMHIYVMLFDFAAAVGMMEEEHEERNVNSKGCKAALAPLHKAVGFCMHTTREVSV